MFAIDKTQKKMYYVSTMLNELNTFKSKIESEYMQNISQNQPTELDPLEVYMQARRMGISATFLAKRHKVSKSYVTMAFKGRPGTYSMLVRAHKSLNVIAAQRSVRAAAKLRSIDNSIHERVGE